MYYYSIKPKLAYYFVAFATTLSSREDDRVNLEAVIQSFDYYDTTDDVVRTNYTLLYKYLALRPLTRNTYSGAILT